MAQGQTIQEATSYSRLIRIVAFGFQTPLPFSVNENLLPLFISCAEH